MESQDQFSNPLFLAAAEVRNDSFLILKPINDPTENADFAIAYFNTHFKTMFVGPQDVTIGDRLSSVFPLLPAIGWMDKLAEALAKSTILEDEDELPIPDSELHWYRYSALPLGDMLAVSLCRTTEHRQRAQALKESSELSSLLARNLPDTVFFQDRDLRYLWLVNPDESLTSSLVLHKTEYDIFENRADADQIARIKQQVIEQGVTLRDEMQLARNGTTRYYDVTYVPRHDDDGVIVGLVGFARDITERKRVERVEREQRTLLEALRDTALLLNSSLDLDEVLDRALENIGRVVPYDAACILLVEGKFVNIIRYQGYDEAVMARWANPYVIESFLIPGIETMRATGKPLLIPAIDRDPGFFELPGVTWVRSCLNAPILVRGELIGILRLDSAQSGFFTQEHAERLAMFAYQTAIALQNARFHKRSQEIAAQNERQRLARDLHDSVTQTLFSASMVAQTLPHLWQRNPEDIKPGLTQLTSLTRGALAEMRTLLVELRPTAIEQANLADLIAQLLNAISGRTSIEHHFVVEGSGTLPGPVQIVFYRVAQEAFNNIVKHAEAQSILVKLWRSPDRVRLYIEDDGVGFNIEAISGKHFGLRIMRERADSVGAILSVQSQPGQGCLILLDWESKGALHDQSSTSHQSHVGG